MKYLYETRAYVEKNIDSIPKMFGNDSKIFFVSGSFGDHAVVAAYIREINGPVNIICREQYVQFFRLFRPDVNILPSENVEPLLSNFFINTSGWLYDRSWRIVPTLPVFYPVTVELIDQYPIIPFNEFFKYVLGVKKTEKIRPLKNINELGNQFKERLGQSIPNLTKFVLIAPETNSIAGLPIHFWRDCIEAIANIPKVVLVINASPNFLARLENIRSNKTIYKIFLEPKDTFSAVQSSSYTLFGPSGFYHFSRYLCQGKKIGVVSDWRDSERVSGANESISYPTIFQEKIFDDLENVHTTPFRIFSESEHPNLIKKICFEISEVLLHEN
jgi:hypothetical protein